RKQIDSLKSTLKYNALHDLISHRDISFDGHHTDTSLLYVIKTNDLKLTKYLIELGINVNFLYQIQLQPGSSDYVLQISLLKTAVDERKFNIIKLLLDNSADFNTLDVQLSYSSTSIYDHDHCANIVHLFVQHGAYINQLDIHRENSIGYFTIMKYLAMNMWPLLANSGSMNTHSCGHRTSLR
ncbi:unnamed protein product, partial [Didymodactylos carnosus]